MYALIPLLMAGLGLGGWLWLRGEMPEVGTPVGDAPDTTGDATALRPSIEITDTPGDGFGLILGPATPWAVAGGPGEAATPENPAVEEPTVSETPLLTIALQGPPASSSFGPEDVVSFFWRVPDETVPGSRYVVYLISDERVPLGSISQANFGDGYWLQAVPGQIVGQPGNYSWVVVLEDEETGGILGQSDIRSLTIVGNR